MYPGPSKSNYQQVFALVTLSFSFFFFFEKLDANLGRVLAREPSSFITVWLEMPFIYSVNILNNYGFSHVRALAVMLSFPLLFFSTNYVFFISFCSYCSFPLSSCIGITNHKVSVVLQFPPTKKPVHNLKNLVLGKFLGQKHKATRLL